MLSGDAVHNIADGIVLVPAFLIDVWVGVGTAVAIFLHEFVQEIAEFFVLKEAGYTTRQALIRNFAVSATILIGVLLAFFAVSIETLEAPLLAFAGGGFTYVILRDLLPSIIRSVQSGHRVAYFILAAVIGAGLLSSIQAITPHGHEHKEGRSGVETERHYD
jgi:zinc and cadmium transporter